MDGSREEKMEKPDYSELYAQCQEELQATKAALKSARASNGYQNDDIQILERTLKIALKSVDRKKSTLSRLEKDILLLSEDHNEQSQTIASQASTITEQSQTIAELASDNNMQAELVAIQAQELRTKDMTIDFQHNLVVEQGAEIDRLKRALAASQAQMHGLAAAAARDCQP